MCNVSGPWFPVGLRRPLCFVLVDHTLWKCPHVTQVERVGGSGRARAARGANKRTFLDPLAWGEGDIFIDGMLFSMHSHP